MKRDKIVLTDDDKVLLGRACDYYLREVREWWTLSELKKAHNALGIKFSR